MFIETLQIWVVLSLRYKKDYKKDYLRKQNYNIVKTTPKQEIVRRQTWNSCEDVDADDEADDGERATHHRDPAQQLVHELLEEIFHLIDFFLSKDGSLGFRAN